MSPCSTLACLLVLLGAVLAASGFPRHRRAPCVSVSQHVSERMTQKQLIHTSLDVYKRIFSSILAHSNHHTQGESTASVGLLDQVSDSKRSEVESALKNLQDKMEELKNRLTHVNHNKEEILYRLNQIKVDDLMAQKRALAEYLGVFQAASVIAHASC
uniref:Uncharacterized protein n=1 Tax=Pundamilia nyererei TaxID=303518 RepID=A0A3B4G1J8_9CICH